MGDYAGRIKGRKYASSKDTDYRRGRKYGLRHGIESGMVNMWTSDDNNDWQTVTFNQKYHDPVVIAGIPSEEGGDSITIVVKDVTSKGFKMKMHEPDCYDGKHPAEEHVGWMVG